MKIVSVNISEEKGTTKHPVDRIVIDGEGVKGDAHSGQWHRQVSILSSEIIAEFESEIGRKIKPGEFAENLTVSDVDLRHVGVMDRIVSGTLDLEVTQIGKHCHGDNCAIFKEVGRCVMPKEGVFCRVLGGGSLTGGDRLEHRPRPLTVRVIVLSDRASRGEYADRSGPAIEEQLGTFLTKKRWHPVFARTVIPDDAGRLRAELACALKENTDIIVTSGGTGVGPRDITPEVVSGFCDKQIPGIMDSIRVTYGAVHPNALLSRSVAGVKGKMLVYALPGSVKAVGEYVAEIVKTIEHLILMLHAVDSH